VARAQLEEHKSKIERVTLDLASQEHQMELDMDHDDARIMSAIELRLTMANHPSTDALLSVCVRSALQHFY
jgi:hypothetical protein